jgi:hypothetical protein
MLHITCFDFAWSGVNHGGCSWNCYTKHLYFRGPESLLAHHDENNE